MPSVPTLATTAGPPACASASAGGERELLVAPALARARHVHRRLAARDDAARARPTPAARASTARRCATRRRRAPRRRPASSMPHDVVAERRGLGRRAGHRVAPAADDASSRARQPRDRPASASRARSPRAPRRRRATTAGGYAASPPKRAQHVERVGERGWRRPPSVPRRSRSGRRRRRRRSRACGTAPRGARREPAALDRRQMLAHRVQRVDVGARAQQLRRSSRRLSSSVSPSAGTAISADAPPDSSTSSVSSARSDRGERERAAAGALAARRSASDGRRRSTRTAGGHGRRRRRRRPARRERGRRASRGRRPPSPAPPCRRR